MAKRSASELDAIIRDKMPGFHLARQSPGAVPDEADAAAPHRRQPRAAPESSTPSIGDLRAKYLGGSDSSGSDLGVISDAEEEAEIVNVEPDAADDEPRHAKSVVISSDGEILGAQG